MTYREHSELSITVCLFLNIGKSTGKRKGNKDDIWGKFKNVGILITQFIITEIPYFGVQVLQFFNLQMETIYVRLY